jgi:radical SAM protein with 4Fe4S-binding SPASM domain
MLYRQKFDTFIRIYNDVGYIINRSNFSDRVTDASGAVFLKALSRKPKSLSKIVCEIATAFLDVDNLELEKDVIEFYSILEDGGFIVSGNSEAELYKKDKRFSYKNLNSEALKRDMNPFLLRAEKTSQELLDEHFKRNPHLRHLQIELTSRCNERCVHCYIPHENKTDDIDSSLFYNVLDQCIDMGVMDLTFSGGEPLLHKNFCDFLRKAKKYDFSVNILTNLTLLNDEIIAVMKDSRLSTVQVSLYSMDPDIHDSITTVNGSFNNTMTGIYRLIENDIPLQISCPTMKQNKYSYRNVLEWANEHKIRAVSDFIMMARYDHTTSNLDNRLSLEEAEQVIKDIMLYDAEYQEQILNADVDQFMSSDISNDVLCGVCISSICMVANGNLYPCAGWQNYVVGNITETPLKEIWKNSSKVQYLRKLRKKDFPKCIQCEDRAFCAICLVRNANENPEGDPLRINEHFCKVAALNRKIVLGWKEKLQKEAAQ